MSYQCPNTHCPSSLDPACVVKDGYYRRKEDSQIIPRYRCQLCGKRFSASTSTLEYKQKRRRLNHQIKEILVSNVSLRRCAEMAHTSRNTVAKKMHYLAEVARRNHQTFLNSLKENQPEHIQMDDLITSEHTKLKPLTVTIVIDKTKRHLLNIKVGRIPCSGPNADKAKEKYGKRKCEHKKTIKCALEGLKDVIAPNATFATDEHQNYPKLIQEFFPKAMHERFKSRDARDLGQGELKKGGFDPLFMLNHTCATLRGCISRLIRQTWCISKLAEKLQDHIDIFIDYFNQKLVAKEKEKEEKKPQAAK